MVLTKEIMLVTTVVGIKILENLCVELAGLRYSHNALRMNPFVGCMVEMASV